MIGLDANVLIRYVVRDDPEQTRVAASILESLSTERPGFITHLALAEFDWVLNRTYRQPKEIRLALIRGLIETEAMEFEDGESVVRALALAEAGADFADALIAASMELFGVSDGVTFDRKAARILGWRLADAS
jgi:predicted nucleic-acid-binding protein